MLTSVPWVVVLLGVGLLTTLLLFALLSFRGTEHRATPRPAPPMYLPNLPAMTPTATPSDEPMAVEAAPSPSRTASATPSPRSSSRRPSATATATTTERPTTTSSGSLTARYQATASDRDSFEARLTVVNGSGRSQDWQVELLFTGNVKGIQVSSSGVSVTSQGNGWFVLRGTSPLGAGGDTTVNMTFSRSGSGDRPGQCSVNGEDCAIG